ncbi:SatD family protein [Microbacterium sp.]|uniref:SatD family protein n=1 Tax=Microbacterium sp. TaxID=51671 RepID=UPI00281153D5|nr:SatD family protein [Microbacterium sp.]
MVIAVIADIVGSRRLEDRADAQRVLDEAIARVERDRPLATRPLTPTVGDEQQGTYPGLGAALTSLLMLQLALPDGIGFRFGVGIGEIRPIESASGPLTDGPGWWAARKAIDTVHARERGSAPNARTWIVGAPGQDEVMDSTVATANAYLLLRDELVGSMSERERRLAYGRVIGTSQQELADREGITQPAVSKALRRSGAVAILQGLAELTGDAA